MLVRSKSLSHTLEWVAIGAIILVAVYLRMGNPGIIEFKRDEANLSLLALDLAHGKTLPLLGIGSSVGFPNAPVSVYLLAIPYFFSSDPIIATEFVAALNVVAVALIYVVGRRYSGISAGLLAALLLAANPWAVMFSRKIWAQNILIVFILAVLLTGLAGFIDGRRWGQLLHLPLLALVGQIHYGAFVLIPVSLYLLWYGRGIWHRRMLLYSIAITVLCFVPYVVGLLQASLGNLSAVRDTLASVKQENASPLMPSLQAVDGALTLVAGKNIHAFVGTEQVNNFLATVPKVDWLLSSIPVLLTVASGYLITIRGFRNPYLNSILIGLFFPIVSFTFRWTQFHIHYLIPTLPFAFLLFGEAFNQFFRDVIKYKQLRRNLSRFIIKGFVGFVLIVALVQILLTVKMLHFVDTNDTPGGFGTPIHYLHNIRSFALSENMPIIGNVGGTAVGIDDEATIWSALLYDVASSRFEDKTMLVFPEHPSLVIRSDCSIEGKHFVLRPPGEGCYTVYQRDVTVLAASFNRSDNIEATYFANGVEVVGWFWNDSSECLSLLWNIRELVRQSGDYQFAVQFLDDKEQQIASADQLSWPRQFWLRGDTIEREFCVQSEHESEIVAVRIGMYQFIDGTINNIDLLNDSNTPIGQSFIIDLIDTSHSQ